MIKRDDTTEPIGTVSIDTEGLPLGSHDRCMHDVEILMCTHPSNPRFDGLLRGLAEWEVSHAVRAPLVEELGTLVDAELAASRLRWTPHYDRALRWLDQAWAKDLLEPDWVYTEPEPYPVVRFDGAWRALSLNDYFCEQLAIAEAGGARTLGSAFELLEIEPIYLTHWFALSPDRDALGSRLRAAARTYLRATPHECFAPALEVELVSAIDHGRPSSEIHHLRMCWHHPGHSPERNLAISILAIHDPLELDLSGAAPALLAALGNPFDPRY